MDNPGKIRINAEKAALFSEIIVLVTFIILIIAGFFTGAKMYGVFAMFFAVLTGRCCVTYLTKGYKSHLVFAVLAIIAVTANIILFIVE